MKNFRRKGVLNVKLKKSVVIDLISIIFGIAIVLGLSQGIPFLFNGKTKTSQVNTIIQNVDTSKKDEKYTGIDVIAIGNSDIYSAFHPQQLWDEQGIPSYVAAAPNANVCTSLHMLEGVLVCQKPKVVILEVDEFFGNKGLTNLALASNFAYENCYSMFSKQENLLKCPIVNQQVLDGDRVKSNRGFYKSSVVQPYYGNFSYMVKSEHREPANLTVDSYLPQFIELAQSYNCEILFVCMPSASSWSYEKHNTVNDYAKKYNIPFLDFNLDQFDTGFNWLTDSRDAGNHLNTNGAKKMTRCLGKYLKDNYHLIDHHGEDGYSDWN